MEGPLRPCNSLLLGELSRLELISFGLDSGGKIASEVLVIDEGGPVTANGPSGSRSRFRDDEGASVAVGEDPAIIARYFLEFSQMLPIQALVESGSETAEH